MYICIYKNSMATLRQLNMGNLKHIDMDIKDILRIATQLGSF